MRKTKNIQLANGDIIIPGELVRYVSHNGGWHVGTLVKQAGKELVINPVAAYRKVKGKRWNVWVPIGDVEKIPVSDGVPASQRAVYVEF